MPASSAARKVWRQFRKQRHTAPLSSPPAQPVSPRNDVPRLDPEQATGAVYANTFALLQPSVNSIGLHTYPLRYSGLRELPSRVAEEFLVNSRLRRRDMEFETSVGSYFAPSGSTLVSLIGQYARRGRAAVVLPESIPLRMELGSTIRRRRSVRTYTGDSIPLSYIATILRAACGITGSVGEDHDELRTPLRSTPSGGALYPIDLHVVALRVDALDTGVFLYDARRDMLWQTADAAAVDALMQAVATPEEVISTKAAVAIVLLVARPWRSMRKYGARGMRHVFHESGAIAEHIHLASVALGVGSVDCSSFYDDEVHEALGLDGLYETLVHAVVLGAAA